MIYVLLLLIYATIINANHFNGGTIRWVPVDPYSNSSSITITIIQSYSWSYPLMTCFNNVPITSAGRASQNTNLSCVADCSTDGGYSLAPIDILTDCTSSSSALSVMTSEKLKNVTLPLDTHFSLAYSGLSWIGLGKPVITSLSWSVVATIDLRMRSDGFINTSPIANVFSPQYAIVNKTIQIQVLTSDVNTGDDIRCRWSIKSTAPVIDECTDICYPSSMPSGTTLSNCVLTFQGSAAGIWYAAAIQVEDFINTTSTTPMSSVPVQFLIYVTNEPACSNAPVFIPQTDCLEVTAGISRSIDIYVLNLCDPNVINIADIIVTYESNGMSMNTLQNSPTNSSMVYKTLTWTPQTNQIGPQQLCMIAYTDEFVQSTEYCVTFSVIASSAICTTTSTTTTSTTSTTVTSTTSSASSTSTTSVTAAVLIEAETSTNAPGQGTSWGLIAGISSIALPLALCSFLCCYRQLCSPDAKHRQQEREENEYRYRHLNSSSESTLRTTTTTTTPRSNENSQIEIPRKSYQVYNILSRENSTSTDCLRTESQGSILVSIYNNTNGKRTNSVRSHNTEDSIEMGNVWTRNLSTETINNGSSMDRRVTLGTSSVSEMRNYKTKNDSFNVSHQLNDHEVIRSFSTPPFNIGNSSVLQSRPETTSEIERSHSSATNSFDRNDWARFYLFGREHKSGNPHPQ